MLEGERIFIHHHQQTHLDHLIPVIDAYCRYEFRRKDVLIEPQNERRLPAGRIPDHEEPDYVRPLGPHLERSGGSGAPPPPPMPPMLGCDIVWIAPYRLYIDNTTKSRARRRRRRRRR